MIGARMPWGAAHDHKGRKDHEAGRAPGESQTKRVSS
jgi:hypothetical protein